MRFLAKTQVILPDLDMVVFPGGVFGLLDTVVSQDLENAISKGFIVKLGAESSYDPFSVTAKPQPSTFTIFSGVQPTVDDSFQQRVLRELAEIRASINELKSQNAGQISKKRK